MGMKSNNVIVKVTEKSFNNFNFLLLCVNIIGTRKQSTENYCKMLILDCYFSDSTVIMMLASIKSGNTEW